MRLIQKARREWFGGVVYSENPGFTAFVDSPRADVLGIPSDGELTAGRFSAPMDVHVSITSRCNLRCRGCYAVRHDELESDMSLDMAQAIIDRLSDMKVFTIALGGGEPFLHPRCFEIAEYSRKQGIVPNVTTNGLLVDASMAERCRIFGSVHVSCHHQMELPRLAEPVRLLKRSGVDVGVNVLVNRETYDRLPEIWEWCAGQNVSRILALKFKVTEKNHECRDMELAPVQEQALLPLVRKLSRKYSIMPMLDCSFFPALAWARPKKKDLEFFDVNGCVGGNAILAVTTDGRFKPCSFCSATFGDARELNRTVWYGNGELEEFRRRRIHGSCNGCDYGELCNGGCRVAETGWCREGE